MTAKLRVVGHLKEHSDGRAEFDIASGQSVRQILEAIGINPDVVALVVVNESQQDKNYMVRDGDLVRVIAVIGGG
jgi:sulfur carrier protein ThiS